MSERFPDDTLVVVTDGTHAHVYRNRSGDGNLKLERTDTLQPNDLASDGPAGIVPPESSPREIDEATFAKQVAEYLYTGAQKNDYSALVLVADPQTLGQIRPSLHKIVEERLIKEVAKTLTNSPVSDIERSIVG